MLFSAENDDISALNAAKKKISQEKIAILRLFVLKNQMIWSKFVNRSHPIRAYIKFAISKLFLNHAHNNCFALTCQHKLEYGQKIPKKTTLQLPHLHHLHDLRVH